MRLALLALAFFAASSCVSAETAVGNGVAVDGDTLIVDGIEVRLHGIDAPELDQPCRLGSEIWTCGCDSKEQLQALLAIGPVSCQGDGSTHRVFWLRAWTWRPKPGHASAGPDAKLF